MWCVIRPWRRKIGVTMLGFACFFMVGWVRSLYWLDKEWIPLSPTVTIEFSSMQSKFSLMRITEPHHFESETSSFEKASDHYLNLLTADSNRRIWGVRLFSNLHAYQAETAGIVVPYWMPVITLTVLAAFMLLSKSSVHHRQYRQFTE